MVQQKKIMIFTLGFVFLIMACGTSNNINQSTLAPEIDVIPVNTPTSAPTLPPSTNTSLLPIDTPIPAPAMEILEDIADDGCQLVTLNPDSWDSIFIGYTGGGDPFFQIHSMADDFYFNIELYSVYGAGWTGQTGTFDPTCTENGICVYFIPDNLNSYLATEGKVIIDELTQEGGAVQPPVNITLENITLAPYPLSGAPGCYHLDSLSFDLED